MLSVKKATKFAVANLIIVSTVFSSVTPAIAQSDKSSKDESFAVGNTKNPKNVIFLVGDGMGPSFNTAYRYYKNDPHAKEMTPTAFDSYLKGTNRTYSNDPKQNITDSAAGGTAFSSGHKTYNGAIGVDSNKQKVKTVLERAKEKGKSTGLVSTAELTDATPAAYAAHVTSRDDKNEIAKQFYKDKINGKHKVDVLLGGGAKYFGKSNGNLDKKFKKDGYDLATNSKELSKSDKDKVLGLFADKNMPLAIGASIDKSAHSNDITGVMSEMEGFEKAFDDAIQYAKKHKDTLVVATADHSTGGLTIGKDKGYEWNPQPIKSMKHSGSYMTEKMAKGEDPEKVINEGYGFEFSQDDMKKVKKENKKLKRLLKKEKDEKSAEVETQTKALQHAIQKPVNDKSYTGWTSDGHTGEDVNTYAYGPRSESFSGNIENTESAKIIFDIFK
ncbi:alkaline phosphatase [Staphylococcus aureus]|uniref:alkaline phosphatase n=1 Tax=Staphylococcus aureus TaxID=1280 RepID=UPI000E3C5B89|nr:alkaline phosphatase [Staphylococcus aureus]GBW63624.1 alkaline phosphatase PhoA [Staphylococcus aureus]GBZ73917.1 alkaline phosphatase PhoA [Staphylococcus aureus]